MNKCEWINVEDRLPEEYGRYLCWVTGHDEHIIFTYDENGFDLTYGFVIPITHWMPLPEPPETE